MLKIARIELQSQPNVASSRREETFGNLPTALSSRTAGAMPCGQDPQVLSNSTLPQVQSIDYMVLDLNAAKQELMETQNQFNMTQNELNVAKQEKEDLTIRLEEAQSRIVDLEQQVMSTLGGPNPWQQNTLRSAAATSSGGDEPDREYKVKLVEERDRLLDQKSELQDRIRGVVEENEVLKTTLDETQCELENLINEHERVSKQVTDLQGQLKEAQDLPRRLRQEAQGIRD